VLDGRFGFREHRTENRRLGADAVIVRSIA
jgi:hypothetical protein